MRISNMKDFVSGLAMSATGLAFAAGSTAYSFGTSVKPGPGYFPFGLGLILAVLGAIVAFNGLHADNADDEPIWRIPWRALVCISGAIVLFAFLLPRLGFLISFPLMIVVTAYASTEFKWHEAVLNSLALLALCWALFIFGLDLQIPLWPRL
jgi:hypothetical protein